MNANNAIKSHCFCAIDWASQKHYVLIKTAHKKVLHEGFISNSQSSFHETIKLLDSYRKNQDVYLIYEGSRGVILNAFVDIPWIKLCPVNPVKTKKLNELDGSAKGKSDPRDSDLLCNYLIDNTEKLSTAYIEKNVEYRKLTELVHFEHDLITNIKSLKQRIKADINGFIPELNTIISDLEKSVYQQYLLKFNPLKPVSESKIKTFLHAHNVRGSKSLTGFITTHKDLAAIGSDSEFHKTQLNIIRSWVRLLEATSKQLEECRLLIHGIFKQLPQAHIYESQPGVGEKIAPRLAALFGSNPHQAYKHKSQALAYFGQSPLTQKSGNSCFAIKRFNCNSYARHTCYVWAYSTNMARGDRWQKRYLTKLKDKGDKMPTRYRKLGKKMVAILYQCLCDNAPYDEEVYQQNLHNIKVSFA